VHFLLMALASLAAAPAIHRALREKPKALRAVEVFCLCIVLGIVFFHILPESFEDAGKVAAPLVALGFALPVLLEKFCNDRIHDAHDVSLLVVMIGLALHSMMDGAAIAAPQGAEHLMAWAVVAHRVPDGLFIWCMLFPKFGYKRPTLALLGVALTTTIGFVIGLLLLTNLEGNLAIGLFEAVVAGSLMHVIVGHRLFPNLHAHKHNQRSRPEWDQIDGLSAARKEALDKEAPSSLHAG